MNADNHRTALKRLDARLPLWHKGFGVVGSLARRALRQLDRAPLVHGSVDRLHRSPVQMRAADSIADELRRLPG